MRAHASMSRRAHTDWRCPEVLSYGPADPMLNLLPVCSHSIILSCTWPQSVTGKCKDRPPFLNGHTNLLGTDLWRSILPCRTIHYLPCLWKTIKFKWDAIYLERNGHSTFSFFSKHGVIRRVCSLRPNPKGLNTPTKFPYVLSTCIQNRANFNCCRGLVTR